MSALTIRMSTPRQLKTTRGPAFLVIASVRHASHPPADAPSAETNHQ